VSIVLIKKTHFAKEPKHQLRILPSESRLNNLMCPRECKTNWIHSQNSRSPSGNYPKVFTNSRRYVGSSNL